MAEEFNGDVEKDTLRKLFSETEQILTEYLQGIRQARVFPAKTQSQIEKEISEPLPKRPQKPLSILKQVRTRIIPNSTLLGSPRYFAFVNGSGTVMSVFGDAIASAINQNVGAWKPAPAATEIERLVVRWLAEMIGYSPKAGGLLESGGTMANITAIGAALHDKAGYDIASEGLQSRKRRGQFVLYMSDHEGHSSIMKAAELLGLGRNSVRKVKSREDFTMDPRALEEAVRRDIADGNIPFCVVGQVGSINVGAVDPLKDIARICQKHNLWFHADGAVGAFGRIIPRKAHLFAGLELADSVTLDPHKWLYVSYECGCLLVKDMEKLRKSYSHLAPYLRGILPTEYTGLDYLEYGPQMSRGFRALKLWMSIKQYGLDGYRKMLKRNVELIEYLDTKVRGSKEFESLSKPMLQLYCFRYNPWREKLVPKEVDLDKLNQRIVDQTQLTGKAFMMTTSIRGNTAIRICITNHRTTKRDIDITFSTIRSVAAIEATQFR